MKWIGQHIWDYISRFRNDVYLEDISTGTIASGGNLGLDSNNKIVKADTEAGELTIANATDNRVVTSLGGTDLNAEANMTYTDGAGLSLLSSTNNFPKITLSNSSTGVTGPGITFQRTEVGADDDEIGTFDFWGEDEAGNLQNYGEIACYVADGTPGEEAGRLEFKVTEFDGGGGIPTTGLKIDGDTNANGEVDVTIGAGVGSTTTIAGGLAITTSISFDSVGITNIIAAGETFADNDLNLMTAAAINDRIESFGYSTASSLGISGSANQLLTDDGDGTVTSEAGATWNGGTLALTSADTGCAAITLTATADGNKPTNFGFIKNRGSTTATAGDFIGFTSWISDNISGTAKTYAEQYVQATGVTAGDEYATHILTCATSTGTVSNRQNMITGLGSASANTVNTTLGYGVASTCTVAGDVVLEGDQIRVSGSSTQSARISLSEDTDNGTDVVTLAAPAATSGQTITLPDATGTVQLQGVSAGKQLQAFSCNFYDNISTTTHYLPFKDINEQTYAYQDEVSMLAPCDGRVVSVTLRPHSVVFASDSTLTVQVHTKPANSNIYATWTAGESEAIVAQATDDHHVFHFAFSNAKHFDSTESFNVSLNSSVAAGGNSFWYVTIVVEWDWTTFLGETSAEYDAAP